MSGIYLLLGSNLGDRIKNLDQAIVLLDARCGRVSAASRVFRTAAWGKTDQPEFLNQAIALQTIMPPHQLLATIQQIEMDLGRERIEKWGTRIIDIDILLVDDHVIRSRDLIVPHPQLENRRFALTPLVEIAPDAIHPLSGKTVRELLQICPDALSVEPLD